VQSKRETGGGETRRFRQQVRQLGMSIIQRLCADARHLSRLLPCQTGALNTLRATLNRPIWLRPFILIFAMKTTKESSKSHQVK